MTPQSVCAVYACGATTGLVLDIGLLESTCVPVVDGYPLFFAMSSTRRAGAAVEAELAAALPGDLENYTLADIKASQSVPGR